MSGEESIADGFGAGCEACDGTGVVCADDGTGPGYGNHPPGHHEGTLHPWAGASERADACDHGGGAPCPGCSSQPTSPPWLETGSATGARHVLPIDDVVSHHVPGTANSSDDACDCGPRAELVTGTSGDGWLYVHHSLDGREKTEGAS